MEQTYNVCQKCVLPNNLFGLKVDEQGLCNFCADPSHVNPNWKKVKIEDAKRKEKLKDWNALIKKLQETYGDKEYSCVIGFSGGKDSTALVDTVINEYHLKPFLVAVDIGFMTKVAKDNIKQTIEKLGIKDGFVFADGAIPVFTKLYEYHFKNHNSNEKSLTIDICHICTDLLHTIIVKEAMKRNINYVFIGFSPDQIARYFYETSKEDTLKDGSPRPAAFKNMLSEEDLKWYLDSTTDINQLPSIYYPYHVIPYDEKEVIRRIESKGYILKGKGDSVLTNCHVVKAALMYDFYRYGGITYAVQYAELIRQKTPDEERKKSRKEYLRLMTSVGRNILDDRFEPEGVKMLLDRIGVSKESLLAKINAQLEKDPNKKTILANIELLRNKQLK